MERGGRERERERYYEAYISYGEKVLLSYAFSCSSSEFHHSSFVATERETWRTLSGGGEGTVTGTWNTGRKEGDGGGMPVIDAFKRTSMRSSLRGDTTR